MSLIKPQIFSQLGSEQRGEIDTLTMRPTSSANFYINSLDKDAGQRSGNFTINKNQNLFNGFFNRIAVNEVVVDWGLPNISSYWGNNVFSIIYNDGTNPLVAINITLPEGYYTVHEVLEEIVGLMNNFPGITAGTFILQNFGFTRGLGVDIGVAPLGQFAISLTPLSRQLFASASIGVLGPAFPVESPRILGTTFIDIVCNQLTYNQEVKDATTSPLVRDVLYRWYFSYDNVPIPKDQSFFPILQGYDPFVVRRTPPVVKQIRWSSIQPVGQVSFQVYDDQGRIIDTANFTGGANFQYQVSCLLSEE